MRVELRNALTCFLEIGKDLGGVDIEQKKIPLENSKGTFIIRKVFLS